MKDTRKTVVFLAVLSLCVAFSLQVMAAGNGEMSPLWLYTHTCSTSISIKGYVATPRVCIEGIPGTTTKITTYLYLQRLENDKWTTIASDWSTENTYELELSFNEDIESGYRYRAMSTSYIYSGTQYEKITDYSE